MIYFKRKLFFKNVIFDHIKNCTNTFLKKMCEKKMFFYNFNIQKLQTSEIFSI